MTTPETNTTTNTNRSRAENENTRKNQSRRRDKCVNFPIDYTSDSYEYEYDPENPYTRPRPVTDAEQLEVAYWDYYWSSCEIADWLGVHDSWVTDRLRANDIPVRTGSQSQRVYHLKRNGASLERISLEVPHPDSRQADRLENDDDHPLGGGVPWGRLAADADADDQPDADRYRGDHA